MRLSTYVPDRIAHKLNGLFIGLFARVMNSPEDPWTVRHAGGYDVEYVATEEEDERDLGRLEGLLSTVPMMYVFFPFFWAAVGVFALDATDPLFYVASCGVLITSLWMVVAFHALGEVRIREVHQ